MLIYIFVCFVTLSFVAALKKKKKRNKERKRPKLTDLPDSGVGPNEVLGSNSLHSIIKVLFTMA